MTVGQIRTSRAENKKMRKLSLPEGNLAPINNGQKCTSRVGTKLEITLSAVVLLRERLLRAVYTPRNAHQPMTDVQEDCIK